MYSNHKKSPSANTYLVRNHDTEAACRITEASPENDYSNHHNLRHDKRCRERQIKCKASPHSKKSKTGSVSYGKHISSVSSNNVSVFDRELLKDSVYDRQFDAFGCVHGKMKTSDNTNWPALKLAHQMKQNIPQFLDIALQTEKYNHEVKYPLWNTREIAVPVEDDIPIFKQNKVSRGTQVENFMLMKHESPDKHELSGETLMSATSAQNFKTYADAVQYEVTKLNQVFRQLHPVTATLMKTFFKVKDIRINTITEPSELKNYSGSSGTEKQSPLKCDSIEMNIGKGRECKENKRRDVFCFDELVQCLTETRDLTKLKTGEEVKFGSREINTEDKCLYRGIGGGDLLLKNANKFDFVEMKRPFNEEYPCSLFEPSYLLFSKEYDPYNSFDQVITRAKAEIIATEGFDLETAFDITNYLWQRRKQRLPYTRMFTESSAPFSDCEVEAHLVPCPQVQDPLPYLTQAGCHYLSDYNVERKCIPIVHVRPRRISGRYLGEMKVRQIHHQHVSPNMELPGRPFYSNSWQYPHAQRENKGFVFPQIKQCY